MRWVRVFEELLERVDAGADASREARELVELLLVVARAGASWSLLVRWGRVLEIVGAEVARQALVGEQREASRMAPPSAL